MGIFKKWRDELAIAQSVGKSDWDEAIRITQRQLTNTKEDAPQLELIALYHRQANRIDTAADFANQALACDPSTFHAHSLLAQIYADRGKEDKAASHIRQALEYYPNPIPIILPKFLKKPRFLRYVFPAFKRVVDEKSEPLIDPHKDWQDWALKYLEWHNKNDTQM